MFKFNYYIKLGSEEININIDTNTKDESKTSKKSNKRVKDLNNSESGGGGCSYAKNNSNTIKTIKKSATISQAQRKIITCNFMQKPQLKKQLVDSKKIAQLVW